MSESSTSWENSRIAALIIEEGICGAALAYQSELPVDTAQRVALLVQSHSHLDPAFEATIEKLRELTSPKKQYTPYFLDGIASVYALARVQLASTKLTPLPFDEGKVMLATLQIAIDHKEQNYDGEAYINESMFELARENEWLAVYIERRRENHEYAHDPFAQFVFTGGALLMTHIMNYHASTEDLLTLHASRN